MNMTLSRRDALQTVSAGFGYLAFAGISSIAAAKDGFMSKVEN